ncbi:hypothetical protein K449DRAFT_431695 [Hypoxylon sp. EC38]|nr:hypothetical protein K449DRAFT_431695 [Hypoxylon sp. EC38]
MAAPRAVLLLVFHNTKSLPGSSLLLFRVSTSPFRASTTTDKQNTYAPTDTTVLRRPDIYPNTIPGSFLTASYNSWKRTYDDISDDHSSDAAYSGGSSHDNLETASVPDCKATKPAFVRHPLLLFAPDGPENEPSPIVWGFDSPEPSDEWKEFPRIMVKRQRRNLRRSSFSAVDWLDPQPIRGLRGDPRNPQFHLTLTHSVPAQSLARHNYREEAASSVLSSETALRQRAASSSPRTPRPPYGGGKPAFGMTDWTASAITSLVTGALESNGPRHKCSNLGGA